ncbi:MAG: hypothetical protein JO025_20275 [Verrucomicrobia bacterium]|nr:hypothetical protein [Verrucomicrobiota bacterium]
MSAPKTDETGFAVGSTLFGKTPLTVTVLSCELSVGAGSFVTGVGDAACAQTVWLSIKRIAAPANPKVN